MTTRTQDISAAVVSTLTGVGLTARQSTAEPWAFETVPMVLVDIGSETTTGLVGLNGFADWSLELVLRIAANGDVPKLAPEATRATAHAALYANRTLGGLAYDLRLVSVARGIDTENPAQGRADCTYLVTYRILEGSA